MIYVCEYIRVCLCVNIYVYIYMCVCEYIIIIFREDRHLFSILTKSKEK